MSVSAVLSLVAPQYDSIANRNDYIELAEKKTNRCWYGVNGDEAVALHTAHMITLATSPLYQEGEAGAVSSKREGDLSISYAVGSNEGMDSLNLTHFGKQLLRLRKTGGFFVGTTGGGFFGC